VGGLAVLLNQCSTVLGNTLSAANFAYCVSDVKSQRNSLVVKNSMKNSAKDSKKILQLLETTRGSFPSG